jgi:hypothetical protein
MKNDGSAAIKGHKGFRPGVSGNPNGRPKGSKNKATLLAMSILGEEAEKITRAIVQKAVNGDEIAMRLCFERLVGKVKGSPIDLDLGYLQTGRALRIAHARIFAALRNGVTTPDETNALIPLPKSAERCQERNLFYHPIDLNEFLGISNEE